MAIEEDIIDKYYPLQAIVDLTKIDKIPISGLYKFTKDIE